MEKEIQHFENRAGGKGWIHIEHLLSKEDMNEMVKMYARVTIDPHASIGYHQHVDDGESYCIIHGTGMYTEDDKTWKVSEGDITWTPSSHSHGIENIGEEPLVLIALILKKKINRVEGRN